MTLLQFIFGSLFVYAVIHLHKKYGFALFKVLAIEAVIGISLSILILVFVLIYYFYILSASF